MKKFALLFFFFPFVIIAQDDLLNDLLLDTDYDTSQNQNIEAAFKGLYIVNFQSTKLASKNDLMLIVSHRFGSINEGFETLFGLDNAFTSINFVYGLSENINIGVARSSFFKVYDLSLKYNLIKQKENGFPFSVVGFNALLINSSLKKEDFPLLEFEDRLGYTSQLLISRKFNSNLSLQLAPTYIHDNFVQPDTQNNSIFSLGFGGRYKLTNRWSINADYGLNFNKKSDDLPFKNPLSIGLDLETGGHVFQLIFSNARAMNVNGFLGQASGDWAKGVIFFGFNLSRTF